MSNPELDLLLRDESCCKVGYVTDVEGNWEYWNHIVADSNVLHRKPDRSLSINPGCHFVFGGDACDRGCGDIRILRDLVALKEGPDGHRCHLIMGNRDINKMRIPVALHDEVLSLKPWVYWANPLASVDNEDCYYYYDAACKMKWLLTYSMGSPYAFEFRRLELMELGLPFSDDDVTHSFLRMLQPPTQPDTHGSACGVAESASGEGDAEGEGEGNFPDQGLMLRYLELAQIAVVVGDVLFVHGAVHECNKGWVPPSGSRLFANADSDINHCTRSSSSVTGTEAESTSVATAAVAQDTQQQSMTRPTGSEAWGADPMLGPEELAVEGAYYSNPVEWCVAVNRFAAAEVADFKAHIGEYLARLGPKIKELQGTLSRQIAAGSAVSADARSAEFRLSLADRDASRSSVESAFNMIRQHSAGAESCSGKDPKGSLYYEDIEHIDDTDLAISDSDDDDDGAVAGALNVSGRHKASRATNAAGAGAADAAAAAAVAALQELDLNSSPPAALASANATGHASEEAHSAEASSDPDPPGVINLDDASLSQEDRARLLLMQSVQVTGRLSLSNKPADPNASQDSSFNERDEDFRSKFLTRAARDGVMLIPASPATSMYIPSTSSSSALQQTRAVSPTAAAGAVDLGIAGASSGAGSGGPGSLSLSAMGSYDASDVDADVDSSGADLDADSMASLAGSAAPTLSTITTNAGIAASFLSTPTSAAGTGARVWAGAGTGTGTGMFTDGGNTTASVGTYSSEEDDCEYLIRRKLLWDEKGGYQHPQPGSRLLQYGMGWLSNNDRTRSVIYSSYLDRGEPAPCSAEVAAWLLGPEAAAAATATGRGGEEEGGRGTARAKGSCTVSTESFEGLEVGAGASAGVGVDGVGKQDVRPIRRVVVGHQPNGDAPFTMDIHGVQLISLDNSYSLNTQWPESQLLALNGPYEAATEMNTPCLRPTVPAPADGTSKTVPAVLGTGGAKRLGLLHPKGGSDHVQNPTPVRRQSAGLGSGPDTDTDANADGGVAAKALQVGAVTAIAAKAALLGDDDSSNEDEGLGVALVAGGLQGAVAVNEIPELDPGTVQQAPPRDQTPTAVAGVGAAMAGVGAQQEGQQQVWMTFDAYEKKSTAYVEPLAALTTVTSTAAGTVTETAIPSEADTRSSHCLVELLLCLPQANVTPASPSTAATAAASVPVVEAHHSHPQPHGHGQDGVLFGEHHRPRVFFRGTLSQLSRYCFELPPAEHNKYIGKKTASGWYVKAVGVHRPAGGPQRHLSALPATLPVGVATATATVGAINSPLSGRPPVPGSKPAATSVLQPLPEHKDKSQRGLKPTYNSFYDAETSTGANSRNAVDPNIISGLNKAVEDLLSGKKSEDESEDQLTLDINFDSDTDDDTASPVPARAASAGAMPVGEGGGDECYKIPRGFVLLAHSTGYDFKNRLVPGHQLAQEFSTDER